MMAARLLRWDWLRSDVGGALFGSAVIGGYYSLGILFYKWKVKTSETIQKLGVLRYGIVAFLFLTMMALPIKMVLRWTLNIKYIVKFPWINFNI